MRKLAFGLSLLITQGAIAQAQDSEGDPSTAETPADGLNPAPAGDTPETSLAVPEESFGGAMLGESAGALSAEELEKLGFGGGSPAVDTDLKIYGFADVNLSLMPVPKDNVWRRFNQPHSQFFAGNINLYLSKNLSESVRTMTEVRFHYAPHGSVDPATNVPISNQYGDPADFNRPVHLGGVEIERIYVEWSMFAQLSVRVGQFLTPYGVWNVDHGSPVFIPPTRPFVIGGALFPERQTGFEFLGRTDAGTNNTFGYHFTLSNGMGPVTEVLDMDNNKGVGGRLFWENRFLGTLRIGGSIFYAKDTTAHSVRGLDAGGSIVANEKIDQQSKVLALGLDLQWRYRGLHVQGEVITQQRTYTNDGRHTISNPFTGQNVFPQDFTNWGVYGLVGYGFDVGKINLMPWVIVSPFKTLTSILANKTVYTSFGFNVRPIDPLVVKIAYTISTSPDGNVISDKPLHLMQSQVAWAF